MIAVGGEFYFTFGTATSYINRELERLVVNLSCLLL